MIGVLVSGAGTNLQALIGAGLPIGAVASNRRDAPALERARAAGIATAVFEQADHADREARDEAMAEWLAGLGVELVILAGYMQLLSAAFLDRFRGRVLNVHPSLLPSFTGARAVEDALAYGVRWTGATVHFVDAGIDTGPIVLQEPVPVVDGDTPETLHRRIQGVEHRLLPEAARLFLEGRIQPSVHSS